MIVEAPLKPDSDGFTSQQCKSDGCEKYFKVTFSKGSKKKLTFCPYCKFQGGFWTIPQLRYLHCVAANQPIPPPEQCPMPQETNGPKHQYKYPCHTESIKHDDSQDYLYCIVCGERHRIRTKSKPKKTKKSHR
jgi:hypothetical protein